VIAKGFEHSQGPHRVHIKHLGPGFVVDIAGLLPRHTGDPSAVDEHVYDDVLELCSGVLDAFAPSVTSIATTLSLPLLSCAKRPSSSAVAGLRHAANMRHPSAEY
jgi:hypothetical protein